MRKLCIAVLFCALALLPFVLAQDEGADWEQVVVQYSWDLSMGGVCANETQCLLHISGNRSRDGDTDRWFRIPDPKFWPNCINNSQHILDYKCENGIWTTRTKHLAFQMLKFAEETSSSDYTLFCDSYARVLNQYHYRELGAWIEDFFSDKCPSPNGLIPCVNNMCVLDAAGVVGVGATLNAPIDSTQHSILRAFGKSSVLCNPPQVDPAATEFVSCGENIWYNPELQAVIYLPTAQTLTPPDAGTEAIPDPALLSMYSYVDEVLHDPDVQGRNFDYFPKTSLFNRLYFAKKGTSEIFGFLEKAIFPEYALLPLDYIGVRYSADIDIGADPCLNLVKVYDTFAFCENQTGIADVSGFNIFARHNPGETAVQGIRSIVDVWPALTGKLRP